MPCIVCVLPVLTSSLCSGRRITSRGQKDLDQIAGQVGKCIG